MNRQMLVSSPSDICPGLGCSHAVVVEEVFGGLEGLCKCLSWWVEAMSDCLSVLAGYIECVAWVHQKCVAASM